MYSFAQRRDTRTVDEPLYAHYLRVTGIDHPGRDEVLEAQDPDGAAVVRDVILGPCDRPVLFLKQMAKHLVNLDAAARKTLLAETAHVLLIRHPADVLRSFDRVVRQPDLDEIAIEHEHRLFAELRDMGQDPPVVDAKQILLDPPGVLRRLCDRLGIPFDDAMLSWPAGPKPEDGVWAPHWYANAHRSTGFAPHVPKTGPFPERLRSVLDEALPHYDALRRHAIEAETSARKGHE